MKNFNQIYAENYTKILNYVTWKLGNYHDAEDVTSIAFTKVSQKLDTFNQDKSNFNTWLYTIVNNCIIDFIRSETNRKANTLHVSNFVDSETGREMIIPDNNNNSDITDSNTMHRRFRRVVRTFKPQYKRIALLVFVHELSYNEIAALCEIPMGSVKVYISRCREMLQKELKKQNVCV
jgi:RNA polymerase sigma-70 factor (ECF subfamily)